MIQDVLYKGLVERVPYPKVKAGTLVGQPGPASLSLNLPIFANITSLFSDKVYPELAGS